MFYENEVPKQMFFFWGNSKISWMRYLTLYSFKKYNPDWKIILYLTQSSFKHKYWKTKEQQDFFTFNGKDYFHEVEKLNIEIREWVFDRSADMGPSHQSNFFKWSILHSEGGMFSDLDILYLKSINPLYNLLKKSKVGITYDKYLSIGLLSGQSGSKFYSDVYDTAYNYYSADGYQSAGVTAVYKLLFPEGLGKGSEKLALVWNRFLELYPNENFFNIEPFWVYPWNYKEMHKVFYQKHKIPEKTVGLHWYAGTQAAQDINCKIHHENYKNFSCTFTQPLKQMFADD